MPLEKYLSELYSCIKNFLHIKIPVGYLQNLIGFSVIPVGKLLWERILMLKDKYLT